MKGSADLKKEYKKEYPTYMYAGFTETRDFLDQEGTLVDKILNVTHIGGKYHYYQSDVTLIIYENLNIFNLFTLGNNRISLTVESDNPTRAKTAYEILDKKIKTFVKEREY